MVHRQRWPATITLLMVISLILAACGGTAPPAAEAPAATAAPAVEAPAATAAPETPAATTAAPDAVTAAATTAAPDAVTAVATTATGGEAGAASGTGEMRQLTGTLTIALAGAVPPPGAPPTRGQTAWTTFFENYKKHQPNIEVEIIDLPQGQTGEQWCEANKAANTLPDISFIGECNYFRPSTEEIQAGLNIAMDFEQYAAETNPYSGQPWQEDWINDYWRKGRCTERGAFDMWTCMLFQASTLSPVANLDILKEYGYDEMPKNYTELWALSDKINKDGKYIAWDSPPHSLYWFAWIPFTNLAMEQWQAAGGDMNDLHVSNGKVYLEPNHTINWCNGNFTASNNPAVQEALQQTKRYSDFAMPGGGAAFWDPARTDFGNQWVLGKAAFAWGAGGLGAILQAQDDGVWQEFDWTWVPMPNMATEDLINKDLPIYFEGEPFIIGGGSGDVFAPTPNVRSSGEDPNVDLMIRDFFQFASSPEGNRRWLEAGAIPSNAQLLETDAPEQFRDALNVKPERFLEVTQPMGTFANGHIYTGDPEKSVQAWMAGQLDFETAIKNSDENTRREYVRRIQDQLETLGLTALPEVCQPWAP